MKKSYILIGIIFVLFVLCIHILLLEFGGNKKDGEAEEKGESSLPVAEENQIKNENMGSSNSEVSSNTLLNLSGSVYEVNVDGIVQLLAFRDEENLSVIDEGFSQMDCTYEFLHDGSTITIHYPNSTSYSFSFILGENEVTLDGLTYVLSDRSIFDE